MSDPTKHDLEMEIRRLKARLFAAESVACLVGWTAVRSETIRDKALHELWRQWSHFPGVSTDPADWPHLQDESLQFYADHRDQIRSDTLRRLGGVS